jgi:hypothetical protein
MDRLHGHFSTGQSKKKPHGPEEDRSGHFSEGQEKSHHEIASHHGHFSEGQEKTAEHEPAKELLGSFATTEHSMR